MELNIEVTKNKNIITVTDKSEYLEESSTVIIKNKFKFSQTISIDTLLYNRINTDDVYSSTIHTLHDVLKDISLTVSLDGYFTLWHIVVPTTEWFTAEKQKEESSLELYTNGVYFADSDNIYKYNIVDKLVVESSLLELINVNTENTTISRIGKDYISIDLLVNCYIKYCECLFNNRSSIRCSSNNKQNSDIIYKRDLLSMGISIIKYLTERSQLLEAERIIEILHGCNGVCSSVINIEQNGCNCS